MNKRPILIFLFLITILFSCRRQRISVAVPDAGEEKGLNVQQIDFEYFSSKSKITYKDASDNITANVNIRMKKDSIIWLSVSKIGIEGVRSIITKDSIFIDNKLQNQFLAYDFKTLSEKFNFNLTFDLLQAAILGNLPLEKNNKEKIKLVREKDFYMLRQKEDSVSVDSYISPDNMKVKKLLMVEQPTNNVLTLDYENFSLLNNFLFPYNSLISLQYKSPEGYYNTLVTIQHQKVEISEKELKFPFHVPRKYDRKQ